MGDDVDDSESESEDEEARHDSDSDFDPDEMQALIYSDALSGSTPPSRT